MHKLLCERFDDLLGLCRTQPEKVALVFNHKVLNFGQFGMRVQAIFDALADAPAGPVLIHGHKDLDIIPAMVAATFAGRGFAFAEVVYPSSRIKQMNMLCNIGVILRTNPAANAQDFPTIDTADLPDVALRDLRLSADDEHELFYITFTSGSTGVPKGIPTTRTCFASFQGWFEPLNTGSKGGSRAHVNHASMAFDMSMSDIWTALFAGRTLYLVDHADTLNPRNTLTKITGIDDVPVGTFTATPAFFAMMLGDPKFNEKTLPGLSAFWIGGDVVQQPLLRELKSRFPSCEIHCAYGPSEATCVTHSQLLTDADLNTTGPLNLGPARAGCDAMIATSHGLQPHGKGEVVLLGDQVATRYLPLDHPNNSKFVSVSGQRAFYTGDIGEIDVDGNLKIFGRSDGQVKVNGYRIELGEVERTAQQVKGVKFAIALTSQTPTGQDLVLVVSPETPGYDLSDTVRAHLADKLPPYMVPSRINCEDLMPLTVAGKIDRKQITQRLAAI